MKKNLALCFLTMAFAVAGCSKPEVTKSGFKKSDFCTQIDGKKNKLFVMTNKNGMEVCMTNFGARIVSVYVPDKDGLFQDVVLGFDSIGGYQHNSSDFGAFIGRYGNRIGHGRFAIDGTSYQLPLNNNGNTLHGGPKGFQYCMFDIRQIDAQTLEVSYTSADGEMGFPGELKARAVYKLTDDNAIDIRYEATSSKPTVINFTNHSYFNLSGNPEKTVLDQLLVINADNYTPIDSLYIPNGQIAPVCCTPMDFRKPVKIGERINSDFIQVRNGNGYDHNWVLNTAGNDSVPACFLVDTQSGRTLEVYTDEPGVQVYTGNFLDGKVHGKKGIGYKQRTAVCLETQHFPDSPNKPNFPSVVLRPGKTYTSHCIYKFGIVTKDCMNRYVAGNGSKVTKESGIKK
jgi:Galactose mutarotase and related enzymes